ncbi:MAG: aminoglycoside 6'-N-acetyltransferase [Betaproteobacteria bacterium]
MISVEVELCVSVEQPGWLHLRAALWPDDSETEHLAEMTGFLTQPERFVQFVAYAKRCEPVGFVEASVRNDYVNGTSSSLVAFVEGLYVVPAHRRRGVARSLIAAASAWALSRGYLELASDAELQNDVRRSVHRSLGFAETERVVYFRKALGAK